MEWLHFDWFLLVWGAGETLVVELKKEKQQSK
jgi:hypothetical protein